MRPTGPIKVRSSDADIVLADVNGTAYWNGDLATFVPAATLHGDGVHMIAQMVWIGVILAVVASILLAFLPGYRKRRTV